MKSSSTFDPDNMASQSGTQDNPNNSLSSSDSIKPDQSELGQNVAVMGDSSAIEFGCTDQSLNPKQPELGFDQDQVGDTPEITVSRDDEAILAEAPFWKHFMCETSKRLIYCIVFASILNIIAFRLNIMPEIPASWHMKIMPFSGNTVADQPPPIFSFNSIADDEDDISRLDDILDKFIANTLLKKTVSAFAVLQKDFDSTIAATLSDEEREEMDRDFKAVQAHLEIMKSLRLESMHDAGMSMVNQLRTLERLEERLCETIRSWEDPSNVPQPKYTWLTMLLFPWLRETSSTNLKVAKTHRNSSLTSS